MRILQLHNEYRFHGGEDVVVNLECELLRNHGHEVIQWIVRNEDPADLKLKDKIRVAIDSVWSKSAVRKVKQLIAEHRPEIVHVHNTLAVLSPAVFSACQESGVPVVATLHNYRLLCPGGLLYRNQSSCHQCTAKKIAWPAVVHGCYRSRAQSAVLVASLTFHKVLKTFRENVDLFITPSEFARQKFIEFGIAPEQIISKPNFARAATVDEPEDHGFFLYAGRLTESKGIETLLRVWRTLDETIPLKIVGDGPLNSSMHPLPKNVEWLGEVSHQKVIELIQKSSCLIFPSEWFETFGMSVIEAFSASKPVIASNTGAHGELIDDGETGWHFVAGDMSDLRQKVEFAWRNPMERIRRGRLAKQSFDRRYSPERNYLQLVEIYRSTIRNKRLANGKAYPRKQSDASENLHSLTQPGTRVKGVPSVGHETSNAEGFG